MKFPGKRKSKHYFPVNARDPLLQQFQPENETSAAWVAVSYTHLDVYKRQVCGTRTAPLAQILSQIVNRRNTF